MRNFKGILMSEYISKLTILRHFLKTNFYDTYTPPKGRKSWGDGGDISPHVLTWGDDMSFIPPCFDPKIYCFSLFRIINNVL